MFSPEVKKVIDTWPTPIGLIESDENAKLIQAEIKKLRLVSHQALNDITTRLDKQLLWKIGYAPSEKMAVLKAFFSAHKEFNPTPANFDALASHINSFYGGHVTLETLSLAAAELAGKLEQKSRAQQEAELNEAARRFEEIEAKKRAKEKLENSKPWDQDEAARKTREEQAATASAKQEESAQRELDAFIENYAINGRAPGTIDHSASESARKAWRGIRVNAPKTKKYSAVLTLAVVQRASSMLPDYPTQGDIIRAVEQALIQLNAAQKVRDDNPIR